MPSDARPTESSPDIRPPIFISAVSRDLRSCREIVKQALLTLGCVPIEQTNFPPSAATVRAMLTDKIRDCRAVIHIVGEAYGFEPTQRADNDPRRSYTQLEFDIAKQLNKPVYVFICGDNFPYDPNRTAPDGSPEPDEPADKRALQQAHRAALMGTDNIFEPITDKVALKERALALEDRVHALREELAKERRTRRRLFLAITAALLVLAAGTFIAIRSIGSRQRETQQQTDSNTQRIAAVETSSLPSAGTLMQSLMRTRGRKVS